MWYLMDMDIRYRSKNVDDLFAIKVAKCQLPLYGRWSYLEITAYSIQGGTAINFTCKPLDDDLRSPDTFHATTSERQLRIDRVTPNGRQNLSQHITFPAITGVIQHWTELPGGGVEAGRIISKAVMTNIESMVETIRLGIRRNISGEIRKPILTELHRRFHEITKGVVVQFLNEINWRLMLDGSDADDDTLNVVVASLDGRNAAVYKTFPIIFEGDTKIEPILNEAYHVDRQGIANLRTQAQERKATGLATGLLRTVCGDVLGDEFDKTGGITFSENEYVFKMKPGGFLDCWDPNGKFTRLCIHTTGFQCNSIDELSFAYLNIKNKFEQYMATAIYHGMAQGFLKPGVTVCE